MNAQPIRGSVVPDRFNSISIPTGGPIVPPELTSITEPKVPEKVEQRV